MAGLLLGVRAAHLPEPALCASEGLWVVAGLPGAMAEASGSGLRDLGLGSAAHTEAAAAGQACVLVPLFFPLQEQRISVPKRVMGLFWES